MLKAKIKKKVCMKGVGAGTSPADELTWWLASVGCCQGSIQSDSYHSSHDVALRKLRAHLQHHDHLLRHLQSSQVYLLYFSWYVSPSASPCECWDASKSCCATCHLSCSTLVAHALTGCSHRSLLATVASLLPFWHADNMSLQLLSDSVTRRCRWHPRRLSTSC